VRRFWLTLGRVVGLLAVVYAPTFLIVSAITVVRAGGREPPGPGATAPLVITISLGIALILMATVGRRRFGSFGFRPAGLRALWWSLGLGLVLGSLLAWAATTLGIEFSYGQGLTAWQIIVLFWIGAPVQEEVIFRGLLQGTAELGLSGLIPIGRWKLSGAALLSAVLFALVHLALLSVGASAGAAGFIAASALILGLAAGQLRWMTGSLVPCILIHALFNVTGTVFDWFIRLQ